MSTNVAVTIFCDCCGDTPDITGDTIKDVRAEARSQGWGRGVTYRCGPVGDLCPDCKAAPVATGGADEGSDR